MADKTARTHTHISNRAKARQDIDRKVVFKSVLDNPFHIRWPSVPINLQNSILAMTLKLTEGVLEYRQGRTAETRKRKRARHETTKGVRHVSKNSRLESGEKMDTDNFDHATSATEIAQSPEAVDGDMGANISGASSAATPTPHEAPSVLQHLTIGINEVTRRLEAQIKSSRQIVSISDKGAVSSEPLTSPAIKVVLVCRADIDPPILIDHLPHLVAACNSPQKTHSSSGGSSAFVKLVPLPKGAELSLAEAMGLRRVAVMAINNTAPGLAYLESLLSSVPTLAASWLISTSQITSKPIKDIVPTHIKQVRTSAPRDMKAAKEERAKARTAATRYKDKKKSRRTLISSDSLHGATSTAKHPTSS